MKLQKTGLPSPSRDWALFLDFDGTLTELAPTPDAVTIDPALRSVLAALEEGLGGALAIVSGRPLSEIDALLGIGLPGAGVHGLELRETRGGAVQPPRDMAAIRVIERALAPMVEADPRLILERKPGAIAFHYRRAPEREDECRAAMARALDGLTGMALIDGKMVLEVKPDHMNKGVAIARLLDVEPFAGRIPVFAGDDRTDEDGFEVVNARKGVTIKIGPGDTRASHRLSSVDALLAWLKEVSRLLSV